MRMKTLAAIASFALLALAGPLGPAAAGELRPTVLAPNPFAMTPPPAPLTPRPAPVAPARPPHGHPGRPPVISAPPVYSAPCCTGYWAYQWVPTAYTTYVWVPGYVSAEGVLVGGGYQPRVVGGGYYQLVWVNGY
jgi:hypothetical protein